MPTPPTVAPDWATNNVYGAGARPWNGQPNKTQPSSGVAAEGFDPENPLFADQLNWILWNHGQYLDYLVATLGGPAYGSGVDGAVVFDGVATVLGIVPSAGVYTLTRDIFPDTCVVSGGLINPAGYSIRCRTSFQTAGGAVARAGNAGGSTTTSSGGTGGTAPAAHTLAGGTAGGNGSNSTGVSPATNGTNAINAYGGVGGTGGVGGNPGGTVAAPVASLGSIEACSPTTMGHVIGQGTLTQLTGGSGGGGGFGDGFSAGGGGGGAGGPAVCIAARLIQLAAASDVQAIGGAGGKGAAGLAPGGIGGGGGGGGFVQLICETITVGVGTLSAATNCPGGAAGANGDNTVTASPGAVGTLHVITNNSTSSAALPSAKHVEKGFIAVNLGDTTKTASFNAPFALAPPTVGGYTFEFTIARTDGVAGVPAVVLSTLAVDHLGFTLVDSFQGVISWKAEV